MKIKQIFLICMGVISFSSANVHAASAPGGPKIPAAPPVPQAPAIPKAPIPVAPAPATPAPAVKIGAPIPTVQVGGIPSQITVATAFRDVVSWAITQAKNGDGQWLERNLNVIIDKMKLEVRRDPKKLEQVANVRNDLIKALRSLRGNPRLGTELSTRFADKTVSLELKKAESSTSPQIDETTMTVEPDPVEEVSLTATMKVGGSDVDTVSRILKVAIRIAELQQALPRLKPTIDAYNKKLKASKNPDEKSIYALQILFKVVKPPLVNLSCLLNELLKVATASTVMNKLGKEGQGRMLQLAEVAKMGCRYSKDMADALMVLTQSLSARDKARKAAAREKLDELEIDSMLRDADIEERKFAIVKKDVESEVDEFAPYPETELLKVLRAMSRLARHKKRGKLEAEIIALRDEMRTAELEEKAEPALKMLFKMSQPMTDAFYVLSRAVRLLARFPIVGQGFKDVAAVATDVYEYSKVVDTALEDLAKAIADR